MPSTGKSVGKSGEILNPVCCLANEERFGHASYTTELTGSFGWDSLDTSMEHDFLLFNRILQENLKSKMKNTAGNGDMKKLFVGKMKTYGKGISIDYEFSRVEDYYDILLDVKGCKNLYESFVKFVAEFVEKQQIGGHGLQNVKRSVYLESFPSVLYVQLKRVDVIAHSSGLDGGHYFAFLKPEKNNKWFKYDDERVTPVTNREVFEENYGGEAPNAEVEANKSFTSAYALVYIRESDVDEMLASMSPGDIPPHIKTHLDEEKEQNKMHLTAKVSCVRQLSCNLRFFYYNIYYMCDHLLQIVTDEIFKVHQGYDLANFDDKTKQSEIPSFRVKKDESFAVFRLLVADHFQIPVNRFRLWILIKRQNRTVRPYKPIPETEAKSSMIAIKDKMGDGSTLQLYLDVADNPANDQLWPPHAYSMVFLKYFDPKTQKGLWQAICAAEQECLRYHPNFKQEEGVPVGYYADIEVKFSGIDVMTTTATFQQSEIQDGDIICFQKEISDREAAEYRSQGYAATVIEFFEQLVKQ
ncbi:hypothetical protein BC936DRAFT_149693 [Jimgerdemannia flammicorona]|uniref:USP domain-containing protein n=1 Tax=Jimgerdemannia flammicorona TaxID=994334 RepID=A0A433DJU5_9FUNG|nr:hypothetical protein BC936DRAFT_149693 [Jimgerdemannia flammicorona]